MDEIVYVYASDDVYIKNKADTTQKLEISISEIEFYTTQFWMFTCVVNILYLNSGIFKRDRV